MKGVVFNLLQQVVTEAYGPDVWDDLLDEAGVSGAYTSLGSYSDEELERLVAAACAKLSLPRADVLRWFGQQAMPLLAQAYPDFFAGHSTARTFVAGVNNIIHAEVRKLYTGAECPHFNIKADQTGRLTMDYRSSRRMAVRSDRSLGKFHSPAPSWKTECPGALVGSIWNARQNVALAAITISWPSSSKSGTSDAATIASARLSATVGVGSVGMATAGPFNKNRGLAKRKPQPEQHKFTGDGRVWSQGLSTPIMARQTANNVLCQPAAWLDCATQAAAQRAGVDAG